MQSFAVILPAAGSATRFGSNKLLARLNGVPVIDHVFGAFLNRDDVAAMVVATSMEFAYIGERPFTICPGGSCRAESVLNALRHVSDDVEWVAIHDAARPLVSQDLIDRTLAAAVAHGAAAPALPVSLTIKQAKAPLPAKIDRTIPRGDLFAMQTPQIMRRADLLAAYEKCPMPLDQITDDVQLLELIGKEVWLVPGDDRNLKITTPLDLKIAELLMRGDA